uniref:DnaJ heat shock protein family (Hsp40) member C14 n=1 Tax=Macaca mulatta TaxID=9544 RepID=F7H0V7_MACMU
MEEETKPIELPVKEEEPPEKTVDVAAEKKVVKITSEIPQTERMQKRAERFNVPVSLESKKAARAARFGISSVPTKGLSSDNKPMVNLDKLKERAQRFGLNVSSISRKSEDDEKLKKRKERFGIVTSSAGTGTTEDTERRGFAVLVRLAKLLTSLSACLGLSKSWDYRREPLRPAYEKLLYE